MAVDLGDLVELLQAEVDPPGTNSFPEAVEDDWINQLRGGFWEIVLDGIIGPDDYIDNEGVIEPSKAKTDLSRDMQQLVIFYAGIRVVRNKLLTLNTVFRAKAGGVEYETQQAATILKAILDELTRKRNTILSRLSDLGTVDSVYVDMVINRDYSLRYGDSFWTNY